MFDWILEAFRRYYNKIAGTVIPWVTAGFRNVLNRVEEFMAWIKKTHIARYTFIGLLFSGVTALWQWIADRMQEFTSQMSALQSQSLQGSDMPIGSICVQACEWANYYAPVNELLNVTVILASCYGIAVLIRSIKAWIPTVS